MKTSTEAIKNTLSVSLGLISCILFILFNITGCSDMPYTGSMMQPGDVDKYLVYPDENTICLQNGYDSACITLVPKRKDSRVPVIHIYPKRIVYVFYYEGAVVMRVERETDTSDIRDQLTGGGGIPPGGGRDNGGGDNGGGDNGGGDNGGGDNGGGDNGGGDNGGGDNGGGDNGGGDNGGGDNGGGDNGGGDNGGGDNGGGDNGGGDNGGGDNGGGDNGGGDNGGGDNGGGDNGGGDNGGGDNGGGDNGGGDNGGGDNGGGDNGGGDNGGGDNGGGDNGGGDNGGGDNGGGDNGGGDNGGGDNGGGDNGGGDNGGGGTNTPDTNTPDTNTPDTNTPDTNTPDTNTPDTNTPDTNTPDTNTPDTTPVISPSGHNPPDNVQSHYVYNNPPDHSPGDGWIVWIYYPHNYVEQGHPRGLGGDPLDSQTGPPPGDAPYGFTFSVSGGDISSFSQTSGSCTDTDNDNRADYNDTPCSASGSDYSVQFFVKSSAEQISITLRWNAGMYSGRTQSFTIMKEVNMRDYTDPNQGPTHTKQDGWE